MRFARPGCHSASQYGRSEVTEKIALAVRTALSYLKISVPLKINLRTDLT